MGMSAKRPERSFLLPAMTGGSRPFYGAADLYYRYLQYLQYLPVFKNARRPSVHAGFRETPKWQFLELWVAIFRTCGEFKQL